MPLESTRFYRTHLAGLHRQPLSSSLTRAYLTGTGIRLDRAVLNPDDVYEFLIGVFSLIKFAHLFSVFDGSRVHQQAKHTFGPDESPPGLYFTVVNPRLILHPGKNRLGLFIDPDGGTDLFIDGPHIDQYFLDERNTPPTLGTISFALCAIMAHLGGLSHVFLLAAGGRGFNQRYIGYKVWPKLGFDAPLRPDEVEQARHLAHCQSVQDVLVIDPQWWENHGSQRMMTFDLSVNSASWQKLLPYTRQKLSEGRFP